MSLSAKAIQSKIGSVKNIKKITKAMELVSVSKMQKAVNAALATRVYAMRAAEILSNISSNRFLKHELLHEGAGERTLAVVLSSNKGLCGGFNANISRKLGEFLKDNPDTDVIAVGKYSEKAARRFSAKLIASFIDLPEEAHVESVLPVRQAIFDAFATGEYKRVTLLYTYYESALTQKPRMRQLLPITTDMLEELLQEIDNLAEDTGRESLDLERERMAQYVFEPVEDEVVASVLPRLTETALFQTLLESRASEHSARMIAMKNASENAEDMVASLTLTYNKARQAAVTSEISEIAAGAEALG